MKWGMMTKLVPTRYVRKTFSVDAVQVTAENMELVAEWCKGTIQEETNPQTNEVQKFIKVDVVKPLHDRQTKAYVGDWVLSGPHNTHKVYTHKAFNGSFVLPETKTDGPRVVEVRELELTYSPR